MKKTRIVTAIMCVALSLQLVALAFGGEYPDHPDYVTFKETETLSRYGYCETDESYVFEVGGKKFILLDSDEEGNYFVLSEDLYGKRAFDTSYTKSKFTIESATEGSNGTMTYNQGDIEQLDESEVLFSTTDENNIGYWLNNDFLADGNGTAGTLPQEIQEYLVEKEWAVEGMNSAVLGWQAKDYYDTLKGEKTGADFAAARKTEPYTVDAKVALMSVTEYKKYQRVIGFVHSEEPWRGMMLRTPMAQLNATRASSTVNSGKYVPKTLTYTWGCAMIKAQGSTIDAAKTYKLVIAQNDSAYTNKMYVRPCFWLDKDFFRNVKIDIDATGEYVLNKICEIHTIGELLSVYSEEELSKIFGETAGAPQVENLQIAGTPVVGSVVMAEYDYLGDEQEGESQIFWLSSDSQDGKYSYTGSTGKNYLVKDEDVDKYFKFAVVPADCDGLKGNVYVCKTQIGAVTEGNTVLVNDIVKDDGGMTFYLSNPMTEKKLARIITAEYSANNMLVSADILNIEIEGRYTEDVVIDIPTPSDGNTVLIMVWAEDNQPVIVIK